MLVRTGNHNHLLFGIPDAVCDTGTVALPLSTGRENLLLNQFRHQTAFIASDENQIAAAQNRFVNLMHGINREMIPIKIRHRFLKQINTAPDQPGILLGNDNPTVGIGNISTHMCFASVCYYAPSKEAIRSASADCALDSRFSYSDAKLFLRELNMV